MLFFSTFILRTHAQLWALLRTSTRLPPTPRRPGWSGSNAARTSPCQTPPLSASHGGCSSSGTSSWGTSDTWRGNGGYRLVLRCLKCNEIWVSLCYLSSIDLVSLLKTFAPTRLVSPFGELLLRRDVDLVLHAADLDDVTQIPRLAVDLYPLLEEGFLRDRAQWRTREENPSILGAREGSPSPDTGLAACRGL